MMYLHVFPVYTIPMPFFTLDSFSHVSSFLINYFFFLLLHLLSIAPAAVARVVKHSNIQMHLFIQEVRDAIFQLNPIRPVSPIPTMCTYNCEAAIAL